MALAHDACIDGQPQQTLALRNGWIGNARAHRRRSYRRLACSALLPRAGLIFIKAMARASRLLFLQHALIPVAFVNWMRALPKVSPLCAAMPGRKSLLAGVGLTLLLITLAVQCSHPSLFVDDQGRVDHADAGLPPSERATVEMFRKASPSVGQVITMTRTSDDPDLAEIGSGSGFVWDRLGHVVTNNHLVDASEIVVQWRDGRRTQAKVVGRAPALDVAVLLLAEPPKVDPLPIGVSANLEVGQSAFAIGNPFGLGGSLTTGVISAVERRLPLGDGHYILGAIQTDAAINPGNSGGPLLDSGGRVVGVTTALLSLTGGSSGVGFAVPIDAVANAVSQLIETGRVAAPGIGILAADGATSARFGARGVLVWRVFEGSPAARAGLQGAAKTSGKAGDIITAINGRTVSDRSDLLEELDRIGVGATAELRILRDNKPVVATVIIEDMGANEPVPAADGGPSRLLNASP